MRTFPTGLGLGVAGGLVRIDAETHAAASARQRNGHSWEEWAGHAEHYLRYLEGLVWPKVFVLGGGITKNPEKWLRYLKPRTPILLAANINNAGIIGGADATQKHAPIE